MSDPLEQAKVLINALRGITNPGSDELYRMLDEWDKKFPKEEA